MEDLLAEINEELPSEEEEEEGDPNLTNVQRRVITIFNLIIQKRVTSAF